MADINNNVQTTEINTEELMKKFDKDSKTRYFTGSFKLIYDSLLIAFAVYVLLTALVFRSMTNFLPLLRQNRQLQYSSFMQMIFTS